MLGNMEGRMPSQLWRLRDQYKYTSCSATTIECDPFCLITSILYLAYHPSTLNFWYPSLASRFWHFLRVLKWIRIEASSFVAFASCLKS